MPRKIEDKKRTIRTGTRKVFQHGIGHSVCGSGRGEVNDSYENFCKSWRKAEGRPKDFKGREAANLI